MDNGVQIIEVQLYLVKPLNKSALVISCLLSPCTVLEVELREKGPLSFVQRFSPCSTFIPVHFTVTIAATETKTYFSVLVYIDSNILLKL